MKVEFIFSRVEETKLAFGKLKKTRGSNGSMEEEMVAWTKPSADWVKINVDGALQCVGRRAGVSCMTRNHNVIYGCWVKQEM